MNITINTTEDGAEYNIVKLETATNDELSRAIAYLELIKQELIGTFNFDYEIEQDLDEEE